MKPDEYEDYAEVFDFFSRYMRPDHLPAFFEKVARLLPEGALLVDVGGGTGFYTRQLLDLRPDLRLTFVEPAPEMMAQARARLGDAPVFLEELFTQALPELGVQDVFLFCRSLYAFYGEHGAYQAMFDRLYHHVSPGGLLVIWEFNQRMDLRREFKYYGAQTVSQPDVFEQFLRKWPVLRKAMMAFNEKVEAGIYTLFGKGELDAILVEAGFSSVESDGNVYIYRKPSE